MKIVIDGKEAEVVGGANGIPVEAHTKAEYDALTDEQKQAEVLHVITDDNGGVSSDGSGSSPGEVYSEEETLIGTWLGKPLYRRVLQISPSKFPNIDSTIRTASHILPTGIQLVSFRGFYITTASWGDVSESQMGSYVFLRIKPIMGNYPSDVQYMGVMTSSASLTNVVLIIEYTKEATS